MALVLLVPWGVMDFLVVSEDEKGRLCLKFPRLTGKVIGKVDQIRTVNSEMAAEL